MAAASFYALAFTFVEGGHIRITLFLEKASSSYKRFLEIWCDRSNNFFRLFVFLLMENVINLL